MSRPLTLRMFLTSYDFRPALIMGPLGFFMGWAVLPGGQSFIWRWRPDPQIFWELTTLLFLLELWVVVKGTLNSLSNSPAEWGLPDPTFLGQPKAQALSLMPATVGLLAGWHTVVTESIGISVLAFCGVLILWPMAWIRILRQ